MIALIYASVLIPCNINDSNHLTIRDRELLLAIRSRNVNSLRPHIARSVRLQVIYGFPEEANYATLKSRFSKTQFNTVDVFVVGSGTLSKSTSKMDCRTMLQAVSDYVTLRESKKNMFDHGMVVSGGDPKLGSELLIRYLGFSNYLLLYGRPRKNAPTQLNRVELCFKADGFGSLWMNRSD